MYIQFVYMFIYTYVYIVQKRPSPPIPRPCHAHKVDTSPTIRRRFSNISPKKSAIPRLKFLTGMFLESHGFVAVLVTR